MRDLRNETVIVTILLMIFVLLFLQKIKKTFFFVFHCVVQTTHMSKSFHVSFFSCRSQQHQFLAAFLFDLFIIYV